MREGYTTLTLLKVRVRAQRALDERDACWLKVARELILSPGIPALSEACKKACQEAVWGRGGELQAFREARRGRLGRCRQRGWAPF